MPLLSWRKLQAGLGTLDKLIQNVRSGQLDSSSIYTETLKDAAVTTAKINALAITTAKLAAGAVTANEIAATTITASEISANAITTLKINDAAVTNPKLATALVVGDGLYHANDTEASTTEIEYTKVKEIYIPFAGAIRIKFDLKTSSSGFWVYGRVYKNGAAVGTERTTTDLSWTTFSEDISNWAINDLCQIYIYAYDIGKTAYARNFRLYVDTSKIIVPVTTL